MFLLSTVPLGCVNPGAMGVTTWDGISTYDPCLPTVPQRYVSIALGTSPHTCIFKAAQSERGQLNKCKLNTKKTNCVEINAVERVHFKLLCKMRYCICSFKPQDIFQLRITTRYCTHLTKLFTVFIVCCLLLLYTVFNHVH